MRVGVKNNEPLISADFASDAAHFIYCAEGDAVLVDILATFTDGTDCEYCTHKERTWQWVVTGATSHAIVSEELLPDRRTVTLALSEAGNEITVTAIVGEAVPDYCDDGPRGQGEHNAASHGGAQASCTIKLYRVDMNVTNAIPSQVPTIYDSQFASEIAAQVSIVGSGPATGPGVVPYSWKALEHGADLIATMTGSNQWSGKLVVETLMLCDVLVDNPLQPSGPRSHTVGARIYPSIRRPGWETTATHAGEDMTWKSTEPEAFPIVNAHKFEAYGQNTNADSAYRLYNTVVVTPIYVVLPNLPNNYNDFDNFIEEITDGPNIGYWFNSDPDIFKVARQSLINRWTIPNAAKPSVPAVDPNGNPNYTNWAEIQVALLGDSCDTNTCTPSQEPCYPNSCPNPSAHDGVGNYIRHRANVWHEGFGCPASDNQDLIGHQAVLRDLVAGPPKYYRDPVWTVDLVYAKSAADLRSIDESTRVMVSNHLSAEMLNAHNNINPPAEEHNFQGRLYIFDIDHWTTVWGFFDGGY